MTFKTKLQLGPLLDANIELLEFGSSKVLVKQLCCGKEKWITPKAIANRAYRGRKRAADGLSVGMCHRCGHAKKNEMGREMGAEIERESIVDKPDYGLKQPSWACVVTSASRHRSRWDRV